MRYQRSQELAAPLDLSTGSRLHVAALVLLSVAIFGETSLLCRLRLAPACGWLDFRCHSHLSLISCWVMFVEVTSDI